MLTQKQNWLYWREWNAVRKHLMNDLGWSSSATDEFRHTLHVRALGFDKSHDAFTNRDFDAVLGVFRALTHGDDIEAQLRQLEQPMDRCRRALCALRDELELSDAYVDGCCRRICRKPVDECNEKELTKVIAALSYHRKRLAKSAQDAERAATGDPF